MNEPLIGVIGYEGGNHQSVGLALAKLGHRSSIVASASEIQACDRLILPGVGSAGATMESLSRTGLCGPMHAAVIERKVPFLGICIGLQLLLDRSEEDDTRCLGWVAGTVRRFPADRMRVPQIGWNSVEFVAGSPFFGGVPSGEYFYFVNSYHALVDDDGDVGGWTEYGLRFSSAISRENIVATQFHLEKSGPAGLALLDRFVKHSFRSAPVSTREAVAQDQPGQAS